MPLKASLRPSVYAVEKAVQRTRFASLKEPQGGWPILLSISFPKSGTHLLDQILLGFSKVAPFSTRLPDFVQLDLRVDKRFVFKSWIFALYLDISNVTNRANVEGYAYSYDFSRRAPVTGLPILPSLGLRASF